MRAIGFRAEKNAIHWSVIGGDPLKIEETGKINAPKTFSGDGQMLSHFRRKVLETLARYSPDAAGVKYPEAHRSFGKLDERCRVEGVVVEAIASTSGIHLLSGMFKEAASGMKAKSAKKYIAKEADEMRGIEFQLKDDKHRETVLVAVAALEEYRGSVGHS